MVWAQIYKQAPLEPEKAKPVQVEKLEVPKVDGILGKIEEVKKETEKEAKHRTVLKNWFRDASRSANEQDAEVMRRAKQKSARDVCGCF